MPSSAWKKKEHVYGVDMVGFGMPNRSSRNGNKTTNLTSKEAKMGKVMRHTLGSNLCIIHKLSCSKGSKRLQLKLLNTYITQTRAFTFACSTSHLLRTTRSSARSFFPFIHSIFFFLNNPAPTLFSPFPLHALFPF